MQLEIFTGLLAGIATAAAAMISLATISKYRKETRQLEDELRSLTRQAALFQLSRDGLNPEEAVLKDIAQISPSATVLFSSYMVEEALKEKRVAESRLDAETQQSVRELREVRNKLIHLGKSKSVDESTALKVAVLADRIAQRIRQLSYT